MNCYGYMDYGCYGSITVMLWNWNETFFSGTKLKLEQKIFSCNTLTIYVYGSFYLLPQYSFAAAVKFYYIEIVYKRTSLY